MRRRVGIYGGAFDPPHLGHIAAANSFRRSGLLDELWILPARQSPAKIGYLHASFEHRMAMCHLAFGSIEAATILPIERDLPEPSYTIRTLEALQRKHPQVTFLLCMGADSLASLPSWYQSDLLIASFDILVVSRPHVSIPGTLGTRVHFVPHVPIDVASRAIRDTGESTGLSPEVAAYIATNRLYQD